jgi:hypothetical protein
MKSCHQQINILEREVKIPADKGIGADTVVKVNTLPYAMIHFQQIVDTSFRSDIQDDRNEDVVQSLGCCVGNP